MQVSINGEQQTLSCRLLNELINAQFQGERDKIAVAVNGAVVYRQQWPEYQLSMGDRIDVVTAVAGG